MSTSTPFIRKRQVMRLSFGDYRAKIAEEEEKFNRSKYNTSMILWKIIMFIGSKDTSNSGERYTLWDSNISEETHQ